MRSAYYTKDPNQIVFSSLKEKNFLDIIYLHFMKMQKTKI